MCERALGPTTRLEEPSRWHRNALVVNCNFVIRRHYAPGLLESAVFTPCVCLCVAKELVLDVNKLQEERIEAN